ncbi:MAG: hypothetical protein RBR15_00855 [Sphaerochaeta sp.]|nr:hypothetical protein [Sphaerochaeta sp.]
MKKVIVCIAVLMVIANGLFAGPFGVEMGWTVEDFKKNGIRIQFTEQSQDITRYEVFPKSTHPRFESYHVRIDEVKGVFQISAFGEDIETSIYGTALKNAYADVKKQIASVYKAPEEYDYLRSGSIWDEPEDWMISLEKEERYLISFWSPETQGNIETIILEAVAIDSNTGYLYLRYESTDIDEVLDRHKSNLANIF